MRGFVAADNVRRRATTGAPKAATSAGVDAVGMSALSAGGMNERWDFSGLLCSANSILNLKKSLADRRQHSRRGLPGLDGVDEVVVNEEAVRRETAPLYIYGEKASEETASA